MAKTGKKTTCLFVLSENAAEIRERLTKLSSRKTVVLVRPAFEIAHPEDWDGPEIRQVTSYVSPEDTDGVYRRLDERQRRMPGSLLRDGTPLGEWTGGLETPPAIWVWLTALVPYWHVTERLVVLLERVIERERPSAFDIVGEGPEVDWIRSVILRMFAAKWPAVQCLAEEPPHDVDHTEDLPDLPPIDIEAMRRAPVVEKAKKDLTTLCDHFQKLTAAKSSKHVVLITRGERGASWMASKVTGQAHLLDEYSERMPEALIALCREENARLTIIYDGPAPPASTAIPLYGQRHPSFVSEIATSTIARISSSMRVAVLAYYTAAVERLCIDPAFTDEFRFAGVDLFPLFRTYIARSIANLVTLHVTQYEAWRVVMEVLRPDLIVAGRIEAKPWISLTAHELGIKTASIKLGIGEEMMPSMIAIRHDGAYAHEAYPDAFLVWGEEQARYLAERIPEYRGEIIPVGRARSDTFIIESAILNSGDLRDRIGLPRDAQIILYGANYRSRYGKWPEQQWGSVCFSRESYVDCFKALVVAAKAVRNGHVLVKPHPADDLAFIATVIEQHGDGRATLLLPSAGYHNVEVICASDLFVSTVSSMFAEAAALGRVSINIWRPDINLLYERGRWEKYNAISHGVETFEGMISAVKLFLSDSSAYRSEITRILDNLPRYFGGLAGTNALLAARLALGGKVEQGAHLRRVS